MSSSRVFVIIPVLNEEQSLGRVLRDIPAELNATVIVADNGSTDRTPQVAEAAGARVVYEPRKGYGAACWRGMTEVARLAAAGDVIVFLDGDYSDYPEEMTALVQPIQSGQADLVIGSRMLGRREKGALPAHSLFGNWIAGKLLLWLYGRRATDLGPFRALRWDCLQTLEMEDRRFGWTVEMQAKAARFGYRTVEVPVRYRKRIGQSKITGSLLGSARAAYWILGTLLKYAWMKKSSPEGENRLSSRTQGGGATAGSRPRPGGGFEGGAWGPGTVKARSPDRRGGKGRGN